jgi:Putative L-xylulose-5-phosphate 3-epimerase
LKDTYKVKPNYAGQFRDLVIGEGEVDFSAVFRTLKSIDYCAPLVIEMWAKDNQWRENIITAQQRLKSIAGQADFPLFNA